MSPTAQFLAGLIVVMGGLVVAIVVGVSLRGIFTRPKLDPEIDPRADHYRIDARCGNCSYLLKFWVPQGKTVPEAQVIQTCPRCRTPRLLVRNSQTVAVEPS